MAVRLDCLKVAEYLLLLNQLKKQQAISIRDYLAARARKIKNPSLHRTNLNI